MWLLEPLPPPRLDPPEEWGEWIEGLDGLRSWPSIVFWRVLFSKFPSFSLFLASNKLNVGMIKIVSERGLSTHYTVDTHTQAVHKSTITTHKHKWLQQQLFNDSFFDFDLKLLLFMFWLTELVCDFCLFVLKKSDVKKNVGGLNRCTYHFLYF